MEEPKVLTLNECLQAIDNAYATGRANVSEEEKQEMINHIKSSISSWSKQVLNKTEENDKR